MGFGNWSTMKPQHAMAGAGARPDAFLDRVNGKITPAEYVRVLDERIAARRASARAEQRKK